MRHRTETAEIMGIGMRGGSRPDPKRRKMERKCHETRDDETPPVEDRAEMEGTRERRREEKVASVKGTKAERRRAAGRASKRPKKARVERESAQDERREEQPIECWRTAPRGGKKKNADDNLPEDALRGRTRRTDWDGREMAGPPGKGSGAGRRGGRRWAQARRLGRSTPDPCGRKRESGAREGRRKKKCGSPENRGK